MTLQPRIPLRAPTGIAAFHLRSGGGALTAVTNAFCSAPAVLSIEPLARCHTS
jgi:hypothetical protein